MDSPDSKLQIESICSVGIIARFEDIFEKLKILARQCTLRDLTPGAKYRVSIRTVNMGQIESDWSQIDLATKAWLILIAYNF